MIHRRWKISPTQNPTISHCSINLPPTKKPTTKIDSNSIESNPAAFPPTIFFQNSSPTNQPFSFLYDAEPDLLLSLLEREHPQAICFSPRPFAAEQVWPPVGPFVGIHPNRSRSPLGRSAKMPTPPFSSKSNRQVEASLKARQSNQSRTAGMAAVAAILGASDHASRRQILHNLSVHDRPLAHRLTPPPVVRQFTFADVCRLSSAALARVIHAVDRRTAMLALAGAPPEMVDHVFDELPEEDFYWISQGLTTLGPLRLSDFDRAQAEMVKAAQQLHAAGQLLGLGPHHLTAVA